ncbi:unknown [Alistipes sp. CAG:157]|nr:unknown [Alistipes sp. CAG:157]
MDAGNKIALSFATSQKMNACLGVRISSRSVFAGSYGSP